MSDPATQEILDRLNIQEMRNRYAAHIDACEWEKAANLFAEDGEFIGIEVAKGRPAVQDWFSRSVPGTFSAAWHMCTNSTTYLDGDRATGTTAFTFYCVDAGTARVGLGHYKDSMIRTVDGWRFARREARFDRFFDWHDGFAHPLQQSEEVS